MHGGSTGEDKFLVSTGWAKRIPLLMNSRGAATECSPGREPGVFFRNDLSPGGAKESSQSFAPPGLRCKTTPTPGLRPGLLSVAAPRLNTDAGFSANSLPTTNH